MFDKNQQQENDEVDEQPVHDPDIHEFNAWGLRQFWGDRTVESVHDQHGCNSHGDAGLEMLSLEVQGDLEEKEQILVNTSLVA